MKKAIVFLSLILNVSTLFAQQKILFDNTKSETAGNADWVIDNDMPIPSPAQSGITVSSPESYWLGGLSSWGVEMVKQGFWVETLPSSGSITYGNVGNAQDLSNYDVFVVCEPNNPFSESEKTAIMNFVYNGGGLFIVGDHAIADRDGDGWDALMVWNDFMTVNPVKTNPFGILFDAGSNISATPSLNVSSLITDPILHGIKGDVEGIDFHNGGMMTINATDNPTVKAAVYQTGYSNTGTTGVMVAYATYGSGRVVAVGDSSVPEDETAQSGTTYPGWTEPLTGIAAGDDGVLITNGTLWLAGGGSVIVDPEPTNNVTNFTASDPTLNSINLTWTDATGGTLPTGYLVKWSTNPSIPDPTDGVPEVDGVGIKNITQGVQTYTVTGLTANTTYYLKIFPYTNSGVNINYLVTSTPTSVAATLFGMNTINSENFDNCSSLTWSYYDVSGDDYWICSLGYSEINGYGGTVDEDWLISPALNLDIYSDEVLTFKTATQYAGPALELVYSTDYDGVSNPTLQGTWNSLSYTGATTISFTQSGNISLAGISGTSVYIAFRYAATGTTSGTVALWRVDDILIEGLFCDAPIIEATNINFSAVGTDVMTIDWTNGNGGKRIVKMNTTNSFTNPVDGTDPVASTIYSGGEQVIYNDSGNSVTVTGLLSSTTYWFKVYEYNCTGVNTKYIVSSSTNNPNSQSTNDITPPTVLAYTPTDNATTVSATDDLILAFSENVWQGTGGNITIYNSNGTIFEAIPYDDPRISIFGSDIVINPTNSFASNSAYYVNVDASAIQDMAGNAFAGISGSTAWNFTTLDTAPPTVLAYSPADNATTVSATDNLILTFNENVKRGTTGSITIYNSSGVVFEAIPYSDSRISISGNAVIINPTNSFASSSAYYVNVDAMAIQDMAGNAFAGISGSTAWNFVTLDTAPPTVLAYSPADNSTTMSATSNLILTFSENVKKGTSGGITIYNSNATIFETIPYSDSRISISGNAVIINPTGTFASGTAYYVNVDASAIQDMAGNAFAGISGSTAWNFTTLDTAPPTVLAYSPVDNATAVSATDNLILTFSENVKQGIGGSITIYNSDGSIFEAIPYNDPRISILGSAVIINPTGTFASETAYYVNVDASAIQDMAGNAFVGISGSTAWNFVSIDTALPTVLAYSPADNATTVSATDNLILTFNENVKQGIGGSITIYNSDGSIFEAIPYNDSRISILGSAVIINPTSTFASGMAYYVNVDAAAIQDMVGNAFAGISGSTAWNFVIIDTVPPTVLTYSPADNATTVSATDKLILTFSENVKQGIGGSITIYNSNATIFEIVPYNDPRVSISGSIVTIDLTGSFASSSAYYVNVDAAVIQDMVGNAFAGISGSTAWNFTTLDTTPPTVLAYSPADNATTVSVTDNLILTFGENVKKGTGGSITIYNTNGTIFESIPYNDSRISISGNAVIINSVGTFASGTAYYVNVDATAIQDMSGNYYLGISNNTVWNFLTKSVSAIWESNDYSVLIYPNPTNDLFTVVLPDNVNLCAISIFDSNGRIVKKIDDLTTKDMPIDMSKYAKGVYVISLQVNGKFYSQKLIVK